MCSMTGMITKLDIQVHWVHDNRDYQILHVNLEHIIVYAYHHFLEDTLVRHKPGLCHKWVSYNHSEAMVDWWV